MASVNHSLTVEKARSTLHGYEVYIPESGEQYEVNLDKAVCEKNPGHKSFIAIDDFSLDHFPPRYRDPLLHDWVKCGAQLTGLLITKHVSVHRPETWPGNDKPYPCGNVKDEDRNLPMTGTGFVCGIEEKFHSDDGSLCPCNHCKERGPRSSTWGKFSVMTAGHVIFDDSEVKRSELRLFYKSGSYRDPQVKVAYGLEVVDSDIGHDWSELTFLVHEKEVYDLLCEIWRKYDTLRGQVYSKYNPFDNNDLAMIVSHPHGCPQHITVGKWTRREKTGSLGKRLDYSRYRYDTQTCGGSSGAHVLLPGWSCGCLVSYHHCHSHSDEDGNHSATYRDVRW